MQPQCLCVPLVTAASESFTLCMRGFECGHTATHAHILYTTVVCTHITANKPSHLGFTHKIMKYDQTKSSRGKSLTLQNRNTWHHTGSLMFWCTKGGLFQLHCHRPHMSRQSPPVSHKHTTAYNYTPLGTSYLSPILVTRISTPRSQPWGGCPHQYAFQNVKNILSWAHIPSSNVRLITAINITLPTAVAYTQTRVMSCHLCCVTESSK